MVHLGINSLEEFASLNNVPIIQSDGIKFIEELIIKNKIENILEIGTAIGYSSIRMALINKDIKVTTIEKDVKMYHLATKNILEFNLTNQISVLNMDAYDYDTTLKFDLIFIDGAKSQYQNWFVKFSEYLSDDGLIICDNLSFHGLVENKQLIKNRNTKQLVGKIEKFIKFLKSNSNYETKFYDLGDGISISRKVKNETISSCK